MENWIKLMFYLLQAGLQIFAITIAFTQWRLKENNGANSFWFWFMAGFTFQLIRRILAIVWLYEIPFPADIRTVTLVIVPTAVSICYAIAMFKVAKYVVRRRKRLKQVEENLKKLEKLTKKMEKNDNA